MRGKILGPIFGAAFLATPALAHHSHAMFDHGQEVTISGTVSGYAFRNPHVFLYVDVAEEGQEPVTWWIEMSNVPNMLRSGVKADTFQEGEMLTVSMHPLRNGRPGGNYVRIMKADGTVFE